MSFIYLASPYSSGDSKIMHARADAAMAFTAHHLSEGFHIYSPIVHCHEMANRFDLPRDFDFWMTYNYAMLAKASQLWVLALDGWDASRGVLAEIEMATKLSIQVTLKHIHD